MATLQFNNTTTKEGLVQEYEREIGANYGDVSGNSDALYEFTVECNRALDAFTELAINSSGIWEFDDISHTDYPIIKTNLVSGQNDYPFTTDGSGLRILDIYKVFVLPSATTTTYQEIFPIDEINEPYNNIATEIGTQGTPFQYGKSANAIFLDPKPNYNASNGLKVFVNRQASHFVYTDTTKVAGIPHIFHDYLYLRPALVYARRKSLTSFPRIEKAVTLLEGIEGGISGKIQNYYNRRAKDDITYVRGEPKIYE